MEGTVLPRLLETSGKSDRHMLHSCQNSGKLADVNSKKEEAFWFLLVRGTTAL